MGSPQGLLGDVVRNFRWEDGACSVWRRGTGEKLLVLDREALGVLGRRERACSNKLLQRRKEGLEKA